MLAGFDKSYYLTAKLSALQTKYPEWQTKDIDFLENFLLNVGLTAETHYSIFGHKEGLDPNPFFNHDEYRFAKAADLVNQQRFGDMEKALDAFDAAWAEDKYLHYLQFGAKEGINPSNSFDESQYLSDKLDLLKANPSTTVKWEDKDVADLRNFFAGISITPLDHFINFGMAEGLSASPVPAVEQVDPLDTPWKMPHDSVTIPPNLSLEWVNSTEITTIPYSTIGQITITFSDYIAIGTGFLVSPEHVLTSAHLLLDENGDFDNLAGLKFFPGLNDNSLTAPFYRGNQAILEKTFSSDLYPAWPDDDLAVIRLTTPLGNSQGYLKPLRYNQPDLLGLTLESSGYPSGDIEQDNPATRGRDYYQWKVSGSVASSAYSTGEFEMSEHMESSPGASGSPVIYTQNNEYYFIGVYAGQVNNTPMAAAMDDNSYNWLMGILQEDGYYI